MPIKLKSNIHDFISDLNAITKKYNIYIQGDITDFSLFDLDTDRLLAGEIYYSKLNDMYIYDDMEEYK